MSRIVIEKCDLCLAELRQDEKRYWASGMADCHWCVPEDGFNGGKFAGTLCSDCRREIYQAIKGAVERRTPLAVEKLCAGVTK